MSDVKRWWLINHDISNGDKLRLISPEWEATVKESDHGLYCHDTTYRKPVLLNNVTIIMKGLKSIKYKVREMTGKPLGWWVIHARKTSGAWYIEIWLVNVVSSVQILLYKIISLSHMLHLLDWIFFISTRTIHNRLHQYPLIHQGIEQKHYSWGGYHICGCTRILIRIERKLKFTTVEHVVWITKRYLVTI